MPPQNLPPQKCQILALRSTGSLAFSNLVCHFVSDICTLVLLWRNQGTVFRFSRNVAQVSKQVPTSTRLLLENRKATFVKNTWPNHSKTSFEEKQHKKTCTWYKMHRLVPTQTFQNNHTEKGKGLWKVSSLSWLLTSISLNPEHLRLPGKYKMIFSRWSTLKMFSTETAFEAQESSAYSPSLHFLPSFRRHHLLLSVSKLR